MTILHGDTMIDMNLNDEKGTDPTVEAIVEMFPEDFLRNTARESGLVIRLGSEFHITSVYPHC